jgi:hypothetical protein
MICYACKKPASKLCDGELSQRLINPRSGCCDRPMCDHHSKNISTTYVCRRGHGKPMVITKDLCADCLAGHENKF